MLFFLCLTDLGLSAGVERLDVTSATTVNVSRDLLDESLLQVRVHATEVHRVQLALGELNDTGAVLRQSSELDRDVERFTALGQVTTTSDVARTVRHHVRAQPSLNDLSVGRIGLDEEHGHARVVREEISRIALADTARDDGRVLGGRVHDQTGDPMTEQVRDRLAVLLGPDEGRVRTRTSDVRDVLLHFTSAAHRGFRNSTVSVAFRPSIDFG